MAAESGYHPFSLLAPGPIQFDEQLTGRIQMCMTRRSSSKTVAFLSALGLALICAPASHAADQKAMLAKIKAHYQEAAEAYDDGDLPKTQVELQQALKLADENGLGGNKLVAQTYVLYGVLEVAGLKETSLGVKYFAKALDISPAIQVPPTMASKAVVAAFERAENQESEPQAAPAPAAEAKEEEAAPAPPKPAEPAKPARSAKSDRQDRAARSADRPEAPRSDPDKEKLVDDLAAAKVTESLQQTEKEKLQREKQDKDKELAEVKGRAQELAKGKADQEKQIAASQAAERKEHEAKEKLARDKAESDRQLVDEKRNLQDLAKQKAESDKQKAESDKQLAAAREELKKERDGRDKLTRDKAESDRQLADEKRNLQELTKQKADADRQLGATREELKKEREAKEKLAHDKADVDRQLGDEKRNLQELTKQKAESDRQLGATREELKKERDVREKLAATLRDANGRETDRKNKEQQDRTAHEKLAEGPELPGHISEPIACTIPDEVPPGADLYVHCVPKPGLEAKVVALYYRAGGTVLYNVSTMDRSKKGWYTALIPGGKISGKVLHYYVEARDGRQDVVASNGHASSPNVATVRAGKSR
jgi:hypothetical protein